MGPQAWRGHAEANHRHRLAKSTHNGRGIAFEQLRQPPRVGGRMLVSAAIGGFLGWLLVFAVIWLIAGAP